MLDIICSKCKGKSLIDTKATLSDYVDNIETLVIDESKITKSRPNYFYYTCTSCNDTIKLTTKEVLDKIQEAFVYKVLDIRYEGAYSSFRGQGIDEASGIIYCGQCPGLDGSGNCLKDSFERCGMRRK